MTITRLHPGPRMSQAVVHNNTVYLAGSDKSKLLQVTIWLADMADFQDMNAVYDAWIDPANPAARACGEAKLATPDYKVEFLVSAAIFSQTSSRR